MAPGRIFDTLLDTDFVIDILCALDPVQVREWDQNRLRALMAEILERHIPLSALTDREDSAMWQHIYLAVQDDPPPA